MRLVIRKSALLELAKGMNGDSFEKIKEAIIAHLKGLKNQKDDPELAKATEQLNSDEYMFSHLEKSLDGEWIEKAGYGIGTVRTWRGKKYKKIAQGKWVRVYDKVDRGAKNAMTRLIHQAERIDTPEEMMKFVLANKQRFSDANGKPLDIVDRLNAVIDGKTYAGKKTEPSKVVKPAKLKNEEHKQFEEIKNKTASKQTEQKPEKQSSFSMSDIGNSEKKIKDMQQAKDIIKEIAQKDGVTSKGREKLEDFISYNIGGSSPLFDKIYSEFGVSPGDLDDNFEAAYDMILKNALGKDTSKERKKIDDSFAKQTARERKMFLDDDKKFQKEYKAEKNNSGGKSSRFEPSDSTAIGKKEVIAEPVSQSAGTVEFPKTKEKVSTFKKEDFKSMSDEELKDYEAKLEKELLASNRSEPDYVEKYSHWQEVHQENNDRFHLHLIDEDKAEKQREEEIKAKKEKEIKEKYHGYFDNRKGLEKIRAVKSLEKKYRYGVKVMSNKEFVEQAIENGAEIKEHEVNKLDYPSRVRWNRMNGYEQEQYEKRIKAAGKKTVYTIDGYEFPKDVVDYARFYKEKGKSSRLKEMQKRGLSTQVKKSDSLYEYVQKSIAALKACRAI